MTDRQLHANRQAALDAQWQHFIAEKQPRGFSGKRRYLRDSISLMMTAKEHAQARGVCESVKRLIPQGERPFVAMAKRYGDKFLIDLQYVHDCAIQFGVVTADEFRQGFAEGLAALAKMYNLAMPVAV